MIGKPMTRANAPHIATSRALTAWLALVLLFITPAAAFAQQPSVTAVLDSSETNLGNPVQLQIVVTGASNPKPPGEINVDGLDIAPPACRGSIRCRTSA
jgi:hypothetical protein